MTTKNVYSYNDNVYLGFVSIPFKRDYKCNYFLVRKEIIRVFSDL